MRVRLLVPDYVVAGALVGSEHDVSVEEAARLIERGLAAPAGPAPTPAADQTDTRTIKELRSYADEVGIDLGKATKRADIIAIIDAFVAKPEGGDEEGGDQGAGDDTNT